MHIAYICYTHTLCMYSAAATYQQRVVPDATDLLLANMAKVIMHLFKQGAVCVKVRSWLTTISHQWNSSLLKKGDHGCADKGSRGRLRARSDMLDGLGCS